MSKYLKYGIVCVAVIPVLWILCKAVIIKSRPLVPTHQEVTISKVQGWKLSDVQLEHRLSDQIDAHQKVSDSDWNAMVKAVEEEPVAFGDEFASIVCMVTSYPMEERFRTNILKWGEKGMSQEKSPGEAVVGGYFSYVLANGPDKDAWKARLVARGGTYPEIMADEEKIIEEWQAKLARLEREEQKQTK
jgi:hypothetical protein